MTASAEHILVTGAAGFIGFHITRRLLNDGHRVTGVDDLNDYYDPQLKRDRITEIEASEGANRFAFLKQDLAETDPVIELFEGKGFDWVIHLAAQAGVRYSLENPHRYVESNLAGFVNVLEGCRHHEVEHLVYASSSSVYGANEDQPYSVSDTVDHPVSLYAATKKSNELLAHSYASLYDVPCTGLRYFTVYGPWGRPDMAYWIFAERILDGRPIDVFNEGEMWRDFTYVDDVVEGTIRVLRKVPDPDDNWSSKNPEPGTSYAPFRIYNIGYGSPVKLGRMIEILEETLGLEAEKNMLPMQPGDVQSTYADITGLKEAVRYEPEVPLGQGLPKFVSWYRNYRAARGE
jgi:UDP-glucuronate 4-epimerase